MYVCILEGQGFYQPVDTYHQRAHTPSPSDSQLLLRTVECCRGGADAYRPRLVVKPSLGPAQCTFPSNLGACTVYL